MNHFLTVFFTLFLLGIANAGLTDPTLCASKSDCTDPSLPYCVTGDSPSAVGTCQECKRTAHCPGDEICFGHTCEECTRDGHCAAGLHCHDLKCVECGKDEHCSHDPTTQCNVDLGICECIEPDCSCPYPYDKNGVHPGYIVFEKEQPACLDLDECHANNWCYGRRECVNTPGSYTCECADGYYQHEQPCWEGDYEGANEGCNDIDECESASTCAQDNTDCHNTTGSYYCTCSEGYEAYFGAESSYEYYYYLNALREGDIGCDDIDECESECEGEGSDSCTNYPGSFECNCGPGYESAEGESACKDLNECSGFFEGSYCGTGEGIVCYNFKGSHQCGCENGMFYDECDQECDYYNPCFTQPCDDNASCLWVGRGGHEIPPEKKLKKKKFDTLPYGHGFYDTYECVCKDGFWGTGENCSDINECEGTEAVDCGTNGYCENSSGSYDCHCDSGYAPGGNVIDPNPEDPCIDVDECSEAHHDLFCDPLQDCENSPGSFECGMLLKSCGFIDEVPQPCSCGFAVGGDFVASVNAGDEYLACYNNEDNIHTFSSRIIVDVDFSFSLPATTGLVEETLSSGGSDYKVQCERVTTCET